MGNAHVVSSPPEIRTSPFCAQLRAFTQLQHHADLLAINYLRRESLPGMPWVFLSKDVHSIQGIIEGTRQRLFLPSIRQRPGRRIPVPVQKVEEITSLSQPLHSTRRVSTCNGAAVLIRGAKCPITSLLNFHVKHGIILARLVQIVHADQSWTSAKRKDEGRS
jgi:hypothetical protein